MEPTVATAGQVGEEAALERRPGSEPGAGNHIPALDGLRGVAILLVLLFHLVPAGIDRSLPGYLLFKVGSAGWSGVDLFFVLSGFLITGILYQAKSSPHYFRNFYMRRVLRIFPLYYGFLFGTFVIGTLFHAFNTPLLQNIRENQGWLWAYGSNIILSIKGDWFLDASWVRLNHFWSLAVEEHFYFIWPAMVLFFDRKRLMSICAGMSIIALALRVWLTASDAHWVVTYSLTPCRMDALAIGAFIALAARGEGGIPALIPYARKIAPASFLMVLGMGLWRHGLSNSDPIIRTIGFTILAIFYGSILTLIVSAQSGSLRNRVFTQGWLITFGKYSYGLYVFHKLLLLICEDYISPEQISRWGTNFFVSSILYMIVATLFCLAGSWASWHIYEKHFLKLKRFFEYRPGRRGASSDAS